MATVNADKGINTLLLEPLANIKDGTGGASNESPATIDYTFGDTTIKTEGDYQYTGGTGVTGGTIQQILIESSKEPVFVIVGTGVTKAHRQRLRAMTTMPQRPGASDIRAQGGRHTETRSWRY